MPRRNSGTSNSKDLLRFGKLIALVRQSRRELVESTVNQILHEYQQTTVPTGLDLDMPVLPVAVSGDPAPVKAQDLGTALDWALEHRPPLVSQLRQLAQTVNPVPAGSPPLSLHQSVCDLLNTTYFLSDLVLGLVEGTKASSRLSQ